ADRQRRALVHGAQEAGRSGGVRPIPALEPRLVSHRRAMAARGSPEPLASVVRILAHGEARRGGAGGREEIAGPVDRKNEQREGRCPPAVFLISPFVVPVYRSTIPAPAGIPTPNSSAAAGTGVRGTLP